MLYCPECGAVLSDDAQFCYRCKTRIATHAEEGGVISGNDTETETMPVIAGDLCGDGSAEVINAETEEGIAEAVGGEDETAVFTETAPEAAGPAVTGETHEEETVKKILPQDTGEDVSGGASADGVMDPVANAERELFSMLEELRRAAGMDIQSVQDEMKRASEESLSAYDAMQTAETERLTETETEIPEADVTEEETLTEPEDPIFFDAEELSDEGGLAEPDQDALSGAMAWDELEDPFSFFDTGDPAPAEATPESSPEAEESTEIDPGDLFFDFGTAETAAEETGAGSVADGLPTPEQIVVPYPDTEGYETGSDPVTAEEPDMTTEAEPDPVCVVDAGAEDESDSVFGTEVLPEADNAAPEEIPAAESDMPKFIFDDDDDDEEVTETAAEVLPEKSRDTKESTDRSAVVRALYSRELTVDKPIRTDEMVSEKPEAREARKRKRFGMIAILALAVILSLSMLYYHNLPDNVYSRHMKKAESALSQGDVAAAAVEYNKALEIRPDSLQASEVLDTLWNKACDEAGTLAEEGKFSDAVAAAQNLKLIHPQNGSEYEEEMEKIYSSWAYAAAIAGESGEVDRILEMSKTDIGPEAISRIEALAKEGQARGRYADMFSENSGKILDSFFGGNRLAVFDVMNSIKSDVVSYMNAGGSFPVISEEERAGRHVAYYYGDGDVFQVYIGKLTDDELRIGTADSFVTGPEGDKSVVYEYYTCEWDKDLPGGSFTDVRYGGSLEEARYTYSGKLKNGAYDGDIDITESDGTVYKTKFENGKVILEMEVSPGGARNVVGWDEYRVWMLCFSDEDVARTFTLPYVQ